MSTNGIDGSLNDGIVIASSSIHKFGASELQPEEKSVNLTRDKSRISVREQERRRLRVVITYLDTRDTYYPGEQTTHIGRDPESELRLIDPKVSRRHARIEPSVGGQRIVDVGAGNGIRLNGKKTRSAELFDGDTIQLGDTTLEFQTVGWARKRRQQTFESGLLGWIRVFSVLGKEDRLRLGTYALSLSFLASGFIFLLLSLLSSLGTTSEEQHKLAYRRQAEKRAMAGDLEGALHSLDKGFSWQNHSAKPTNANESGGNANTKNKRFIDRSKFEPWATQPEELDSLMEKLIVDPSIRAAAASQVAKAKLNYLDRTIRGQVFSAEETTRLQNIYSSIDRKLVNGVRYENISRRLFRK